MYLYGNIHWEFVLLESLDGFGINPCILNVGAACVSQVACLLK